MAATSEIHITADASQAIAEVRSLRAEVEELRVELDKARGTSPRVQILREPLTYEAKLVTDKSAPRGFRAISTRENRCYVRDFVMAEMKGDQEARERLMRHEREMRVVGEYREQLFYPDAEYEFEQRAVNWSSGLGGYFAPPLWIVEQFAFQPTPERVLAKLAPQFELPVGAQSVNLPAWSQGANVGAAQVDSTSDSQDVLDTPISSAVTTIAGTFDVPMQMLEQSPQGAHLDWVAFTTMEARYGYQLELQLFTGTGATTPQGSGNNQLLGIFNNTAIPTGNQVSYTGTGESGSVGATAMFGSIGLLPAKIGQNRLLPPEAWLMSTSRGAWLGSSEDSQNRPLMIADNTSQAGLWDLLGFPVYPNDALPRTSGTGLNEDRIVCCRPSDWLILESERRTSVAPYKRDNAAARGRDAVRGDAMGDVLSGTLEVRLQMRRYVAALLRYPTSVSYLYGSGMATAGGF